MNLNMNVSVYPSHHSETDGGHCVTEECQKKRVESKKKKKNRLWLIILQAFKGKAVS